MRKSTWALAVLFAVSIFSSNVYADLDDGLVAHWSFDDCTAVDVTGNGHDGIMDDDPVCIEANCGQAWLPDGINDEIEIVGNLDDLKFTNQSLSITEWIQVIDNVNESRTYFYMGRDATESGNSEVYLIKDRSGNNDGRIIMGVAHHGSLLSEAFSIASGEDLPKDTWLHLAGVIDYEAQTVRLYINGVLQDTSDGLISFDLGSGSGDAFRAQIGAYEHNCFQNGPVDEVRLYDRVLTEGEIVQLYEQCIVPTPLPVALDIKPGSCPNPLNINATESDFWIYEDDEIDVVGSGDYSGDFMKASPGKKRGVIPVAILGTADFDVSQIDVTTVMLQGVSALRHSYEDVSTPIGDDADECACTDAGPDGFIDLTLKFDKTDVAATLGGINVGDVIPLEITGQLLDGTQFTGTDCVVIVGDPHPLEIIPSAVSKFALVNHPNPFNPTTDINFTLPSDLYVRLEVYNIMGQRVSTLIDDYRQAGQHTVTWNGQNDAGSSVASGVYFYRISAGEFSEARKMILMK